MARRQKKICNRIGCYNKVNPGQSYCKKHSRSRTTQQMYNYKWSKARIQYLSNNPLCVICYKLGEIVSATVVDHIIPHQGNKRLFWDQKNWQSLCQCCHNKKSSKENRLYE